MNLVETIESRTSVRNFSDQKVSIDDLREIVRLGSMAPSVNNYQPWKFVIITRQEVLTDMSNAVSKKVMQLPELHIEGAKNIKSQVEWFSTFFEKAPAVIAVCLNDYVSILEQGTQLSHDEINKQRNYPDIQSAGACIQNMLLAAVNLNLGACWMSAPMIASDEIASKIGLAANDKLIAMVAIGYPKNKIAPRAKKDIKDLIVEIL